MDWESTVPDAASLSLAPTVSPFSPQMPPLSTVDTTLADLSTIRTFRSVYMAHQFPFEVREPLECDEAIAGAKLAEMAFFWTAIAIGARGSGDFARAKTYLNRARYAPFYPS